MSDSAPATIAQPGIRNHAGSNGAAKVASARAVATSTRSAPFHFHRYRSRGQWAAFRKAFKVSRQDNRAIIRVTVSVTASRDDHRGLCDITYGTNVWIEHANIDSAAYAEEIFDDVGIKAIRSEICRQLIEVLILGKTLTVERSKIYDPNTPDERGYSVIFNVSVVSGSKFSPNASRPFSNNGSNGHSGANGKPDNGTPTRRSCI